MPFQYAFAHLYSFCILSFQSDHFQAVLTSSDDGTTYVIFLYGILTTIQMASGVYGRVSKNTVWDKAGEMEDRISMPLVLPTVVRVLWFSSLWP